MIMAERLIRLPLKCNEIERGFDMATHAKVHSFEEMISAVGKFISEVSEACNNMQAAGNQYAIQCDNDVPSTKANEKLGKCVNKFNESLETAQKIKEGLERELEKLLELMKVASDMGD